MASPFSFRCGDDDSELHDLPPPSVFLGGVSEVEFGVGFACAPHAIPRAVLVLVDCNEDVVAGLDPEIVVAES